MMPLRDAASSLNLLINSQFCQSAVHIGQFSSSSGVHSVGRRTSSNVRAVKKSSQTTASKDDEWDPDFVEAMNQLCNKAVRVMLSEDLQLVNQLRTELDNTGATLVEHGEIDAARFILVVQEMLDHKLAPERKLLKGRFVEAFEKIFGLVEDAGWSLQPPEEEGQEGEILVEGNDHTDAEPPVAPKKVSEPYNRTFQAQDQFV
ncbi:hypothetical protein KFL_004110030 [Klebsormidium nitens]|uniref:Uncharacterized protein n=1 Tax=Klebsormidium nitens TaxID=105231 RepID=A0A1Y1IB78_KLENI|nr:hypothetical protein KFL_004110030 [Klebsormidium nitens]|eukprot:GAQ88224.1 hypothetical protein KFL_004110030 [Klebsormidium nitens]